MRNNLPLLNKYEKILKEDKSSVVFAPLAEIYRKSGEIKKAIEICYKGLKENPDYLSGRIVLANCYYEIEDYQQALKTISSYVAGNLENNLLQKLWGKINLELGNEDIALECFKKLLFLFPGDSELSEIVENLELDSIDDRLNIRDDEDRVIDIRNWEQKDLGVIDEINIKTNQSTKIDFAKLFNEKGDKDAVNNLLDSIDTARELIIEQEAEDQVSDDSSREVDTPENNLMDYFDLKMSEINSMVDEEKEASIPCKDIESENTMNSATLTENKRTIELSTSPDKEFIEEVKNQCNKFLKLITRRRELVMSH